MLLMYKNAAGIIFRIILLTKIFWQGEGEGACQRNAILDEGQMNQLQRKMD